MTNNSDIEKNKSKESNKHTNPEEIKIFSGINSIEFTNKMCERLNVKKGVGFSKKFSEGNTFVTFEEKVRGKNVYIVNSVGVSPNDDFMELLFWIDAFKRSSVKSVTAIIPFFSYAKADKKDEPHVSIRARVCADCLEAAGVDRILTMDLHSPQIQGFFKKPVDHLSAFPIFSKYIREELITKMGLKDITILSPDAGFAKNARLFARHLQLPMAIGDKIRKGNDENPEVSEIIGDVKGRNIIIVDDFSTSCKTLVNAANKLKDMGANHIFACVTHAVMDNEALNLLDVSPIQQLIVTDTVKNQYVSQHSKVKVVTVADFFADAVNAIDNEESLGDLIEAYSKPSVG